jgi:hypothetical protein
MRTRGAANALRYHSFRITDEGMAITAEDS